MTVCDFDLFITCITLFVLLLLLRCVTATVISVACGERSQIPVITQDSAAVLRCRWAPIGLAATATCGLAETSRGKCPPAPVAEPCAAQRPAHGTRLSYTRALGQPECMSIGIPPPWVSPLSARCTTQPAPGACGISHTKPRSSTVPIMPWRHRIPAP